jgi:hypothetical protein
VSHYFCNSLSPLVIQRLKRSVAAMSKPSADRNKLSKLTSVAILKMIDARKGELGSPEQYICALKELAASTKLMRRGTSASKASVHDYGTLHKAAFNLVKQLDHRVVQTSGLQALFDYGSSGIRKTYLESIGFATNETEASCTEEDEGANATDDTDELTTEPVRDIRAAAPVTRNSKDADDGITVKRTRSEPHLLSCRYVVIVGHVR